MKAKLFVVILLLGGWLMLLGCPPTAPVLPLDRPPAAVKRRTPARPVLRRQATRKVVKRKVAKRQDPNLPPGVRLVQRTDDGEVKAKIPANWRRYARGKGGRVRAVYFEKNQKPNPLAQKLCHALHVVPKERRKICCQDKYLLFHPGGECVRTLTAALHAKALTISAQAVDRCVAALHKTYEGCDWIGFWPPRMPAVCLGLFQGKLPKGAVCRSGLECREGMYCHGLGTTVPGRCWTALPDGQRCGTGIDPLAVYTRQDNLSEIKPQCQGACVRTHCVARVKEGVTCRTDSQCKQGLHCAQNKCAKGDAAKRGQPCSSECEGSDRCLKGICTAPKPAGSKCSTEDECRAGCLKKKGKTKGVCGTQCAIIRR